MTIINTASGKSMKASDEIVKIEYIYPFIARASVVGIPLQQV